MSKGNPIVKTRLPAGLLEDIEMAIAERNARSPLEPWTFSDFLRVACCEKLDKIRRGRGRKGGVAHPQDYGAGATGIA